MAPAAFPHRLRLWGSEDICAVGPHSTWRAGITACGVLPVTPDEQRPETDAITCPGCLARTNPTPEQRR